MANFHEVRQPPLLRDARGEIRFVSEQHEAGIGMPAPGNIGACNDNVRRVVAAHGVQGDGDKIAQRVRSPAGRGVRGWSLDLLLDLDDLAALVEAGFHVDMVRAMKLTRRLVFDIGLLLQ